MIASHYAEPLACRIASPTPLLRSPSDGGDVLREMSTGEPFAMLDDSLGWAWGYAGDERRVGYVRSACIGA